MARKEIKESKKIKSILFIAPATELGGAYGTYPPNGLLSVAGYLRSKGVKVGVIDYSGEAIDRGRVEKDIGESSPDIVALSVLTGPGLYRALLISNIAKGLGKIVVWGGPHVTVLPHLTLQYKAVDYLVLGEGEYAIEELIDYLNRKIKKVPNGISYKEKGRIIVSQPQTRFIDLETKPLPAWDLLRNIDKYFPFKKHNIVFMESHRGCPYRCAFCHHSNNAVKEYGGLYRSLSAKRVIEEFNFVKSLTKKHIDRMDIAGELNIYSDEQARKFSRDMLNLTNGRVKWWGVTRLHILKPETVELMARAGCESMMLGVESGSERIQRINGKPVDIEHAIKLTGAMRKNGILVTNTYMMGHPDETEEELKLTLKYMRKIPSDQNLLQIYRPFPGTPYWQFSVNEDKVKEPKTFKDFVTFGVLTYHANITKMSSELLVRTFYKANLYEGMRFLYNLERHYLRNGMYQQILHTLMKNIFT
ncbi:MAG: radical SAM protein, partial [Nanoarchaeota archaeon]